MKVYRTKKMQQEIIRTYNNLLAQWNVETEEINITTEYGTTHIVACGKKENLPLILFHLIH